MHAEGNVEHSKFWLGKDFSFGKIFGPNGTIDIAKLAAYRRAISNFAFILTGKPVPVRFAENNKSFTDGKAIYIGSSLSKGEFDVTVGLSLHESMHIVKSDFDIIKTLWGKLPRSLQDAASGKISQSNLAKLAKYILNVVEDRYIDAWAKESAPGYRGYYDALYEKYFLNEKIAEGLMSSDYRDTTILSYRFRFTNSINAASDPDALPGLRRMLELLDVENILRPEMSSAKERLEVALAITEELVKNLGNDSRSDGSDEQDDGDEQDSDETGESSDATDGKGKEQASDDSEKSDEQKDDAEPEDSDDGEESEEPDEAENEKAEEGDEESSDNTSGDDDAGEESDDSEQEGEPRELTPEESKSLSELLQEQDDFINREMAQSGFDEATINKLNSLEKHGVDIVSVGKEAGIPEVECIVVSNMTEELMRELEFPFTSPTLTKMGNPQAEQGVRDGIALGKMLGRRLQVRDEVKTTKYTRLDRGKIDRRLLASIGISAENLFYQTSTDKFKKVHLHISVDASGSMGPKWKKTMTTVVALAKAASTINNVGVCISFRSGVSTGVGNDRPYIVLAYDSSKDKFDKIVRLFPKLYPIGSTPEGLAFQAILHRIPPSTHELDSYFVNLSDGEPYFGGVYSGPNAAEHTKKQVDKIKATGVAVMSYFIEGDTKEARMLSVADDPRGDFRRMYGKDAQFIDVSNVAQIAYTLNRKFLEKEA